MIGRILWGLLLVLAAFCAGFLAGALIAIELLPAGSGFTFGPFILGYGVTGAAAAALAALALAWRISPQHLRTVAIVTAALTAAVSAYLWHR